MAREIATGIEPLMSHQLKCLRLAIQGDLLKHQEDPLAVDCKGLPSGPKALIHIKRHIATGYWKKEIV
jgi:hypothetical protein